MNEKAKIKFIHTHIDGCSDFTENKERQAVVVR